MKKLFLTARMAIACLSILVLVSCKKTAQDLTPEEIVSPPNGGKKAKLCQIEEIIIHDPSFDELSAVITYNAQGDPAAIEPQFVGTGSPRHEFRYSASHRLTDHIGPYNNGFFEFWYEYVYEGNTIVRDTQYIFGTYGAEPTNPVYKYTTSYVYDDEGRIVQTTTTPLLAPGPLPPVSVVNYVYDADGNLVIPGSAYDDQVSFRRTNPIWQFLDRDYSVNNYKPATSYNSIDLPTNFNRPFGGPFFLNGFYMHNTTIVYDCKGNIE